jgi:hypothetical protein
MLRRCEGVSEAVAEREPSAEILSEAKDLSAGAKNEFQG